MKIFPEYQLFRENCDNGSPQLVWTVLPSDLDTPVLVALKLQNEKYLGLFESVEGGKSRARYSFITLDPDLIWVCDKAKAKIIHTHTGHEELVAKASGEIFPSLRKIIKDSSFAIPAGLPPMSSGLFGYMGYDMVRYMEKIPDKNPDQIGVPEAMFMRPKLVIVFDSVKDEMIILTTVFKNGDKPETAYEKATDRIAGLINKLENNGFKSAMPGKNINSDKIKIDIEATSNTSCAEYYQMVEKAREYILAGDIFQVVLAQRFTIDFPRHPFALYRKLRRLNPSPFSFYIKMDNFALVGSSPEILVRMQDGKVTVRPIAGTRPRGVDKAHDLSLEKDLMADEKELSEHLMLIDLGRNDVGRVAKIGSVKVTDRMVIERYSHVMHIVSNVEGRIDRNFDAVDALIAGFPVGTVSGAPKIRAMEIIDELEKSRRSFYAGGVGYFSAGGDVDMCIALRTGLVKDNKLYVQSGGGIVVGSSPQAEYMESCNKARALINAAEMALGDE
jgi:anthranilate synthase component 1